MAREDRFYYDVRQYALLRRKNGAILALQLPKRYGEMADKWTLPGGKLEPKDTPEGGLLREIEEETNLKATIVGPIAMKRWDTENSQKLIVFYLADIIEDKTPTILSHEHQAMDWVTLDTIDDFTFYREQIGDVVKSVLIR